MCVGFSPSSILAHDLVTLDVDEAEGFEAWGAVDLDELGEVFGGIYRVPFEVDHPLVDEIR
jgi:hypothetical protein